MFSLVFLLVTDEVSAWRRIKKFFRRVESFASKAVKTVEKVASETVKTVAAVGAAIKDKSPIRKRSANDEVITFHWYLTNVFS